MITTEILVNIDYYTQLKIFSSDENFLRSTFTTHSPSNFQIHSTLLTLVTMLYIISPGLIPLYSWKYLDRHLKYQEGNRR